MVDAVAGDVLFGSDSLLNVVSDNKGVWCYSGCEVVSAVGTTVVLLVAFSLVVSAVTSVIFGCFIGRIGQLRRRVIVLSLPQVIHHWQRL